MKMKTLLQTGRQDVPMMKVGVSTPTSGYNFGTNNYSCGMQLWTFRPTDITIEEIASTPGWFLNPASKPNSNEIFALKGTIEQFKQLTKQERLGWAVKKGFDKYPFTQKEHLPIGYERQLYIEQLEREWKPWYITEFIKPFAVHLFTHIE